MTTFSKASPSTSSSSRPTSRAWDRLLRDQFGPRAADGRDAGPRRPVGTRHRAGDRGRQVLVEVRRLLPRRDRRPRRPGVRAAVVRASLQGPQRVNWTDQTGPKTQSVHPAPDRLLPHAAWAGRPCIAWVSAYWMMPDDSILIIPSMAKARHRRPVWRTTLRLRVRAYPRCQVATSTRGFRSSNATLRTGREFPCGNSGSDRGRRRCPSPCRRRCQRGRTSRNESGAGMDVRLTAGAAVRAARGVVNRPSWKVRPLNSNVAMIAMAHCPGPRYSVWLTLT